MSGYNNNYNAPAREKNAADARELTIYGPSAGQGQRSSSLVFGTFNNSPRIRIYRPNDAKPLEFKMDITMLSEVLTSLEELASSSTPNQYRWNLDGFVAPQKKGVIGTLIAGRDEAGMVYLGAVGFQWEKPERFNFRPYYRFKRVDKEGNPVPEAQVSATLAKSWARMVRDIATQVFVKEYKHPEPKQPKGQNYGGQRQQQQQAASAPEAGFSMDDNYI